MTGLLVSFESGQTFSHVQTELLSFGHWKQLGIWHCSYSNDLHCWFARQWRHSGHVGDHEQNCLISPLGTKSRFHVNSSKHCLLYWPPTWLPYHLTANQAQQPQIMMTFFWVSIEDKISWDTLLWRTFLSVVSYWLSKGKWSSFPLTASKQCCAAIRAS